VGENSAQDIQPNFHQQSYGSQSPNVIASGSVEIKLQVNVIAGGDVKIEYKTKSGR
jgi:hypothetical protein